MVHPPMASVLLSASVERCFVSRMRDFFFTNKINQSINDNTVCKSAMATQGLLCSHLFIVKNITRITKCKLILHQLSICRSVGSNEACYHLLGFDVTTRYPAVYRMRVHLEDEQSLVFEEGMEANAVEAATGTELDAFFIINSKNEGEHIDCPQGLYGVKDRPDRWVKYVDMPSGKGADDTDFKGYTWTGKLWKPRVNKSDTIGRIHSVFVGSGDVYYLRILLHHNFCMGKTSFKDLRTIIVNNENRILTTYKEVCEHLGLLQDDGEWKMALDEALARDSARAIRGLYIYILMWCHPSAPADLFNEVWDRPVDNPAYGDHASRDWSDDIVRKAAKKGIVYDINKVEDKAKLKTLVLQDI